MDDETLRILVATDNHLGYAERDSIRSNDSFAAFEEVLITAKDRRADFVLLAGDMFHENKPSRRTTHTAMNILRKHCLGEDPVFTEILNEQSEVFKTGPLGKVNYEDPYQSISMPVFAIHGNHDDPSREGGSGESLAALDLLSVSNLLNYFGKSEQVDDIEITPILMRKGVTFIALYGLGAVRDERLNRMWNLKKVKFVRPSEEQGKERFFNIFVLHQNRDYGRGSKNCVHESMIPQWMDVVIWGNEHECQPRLSESLVGTYRIYQPGSSVCTSLVEGESMLHPKGMGLLEIKLKKFRLLSIPFTQIRPFIYGDFSLKDVKGLDPSDPKVEDTIRILLAKRVEEMVLKARESAADVQDALPDRLEHRILSPFQVLVRLRVEHAGFPAVNQQRFGAQFVGKVANPSDLLLFAKKKKEDLRAIEVEGRKASASSDMQKILQEGEEEAIAKINIEDLVNETLCGSNKPLCVLVETEMALALEDFVVRDHKHAVSDLVQESLERMQRDLMLDVEATGKAGITEAATRYKKKVQESLRKGVAQEVKRAARKARVTNSDDDSDKGSESDEDKGSKKAAPAGKKAAAAAPAGAKRKPKAADVKTKAAQRSRKKKKDVDISSDDDDEDEEEEADEEEDVEEDIESDDDDEDDDRRSKFGKSASTNQKGRGKKVATVKESKTASKESSSVRKAPASKSKVVKPAAKKQSKSKGRFSEDEDSGLESDDDAMAVKSRNNRVRATAVKEELNSRHNNNYGDNGGDDSDDDEVQIILPQRGSDRGPVKPAPSKAATSATTSSSSSSSSSSRAGSKAVQKVSRVTASSANSSRKNNSDDEVENHEDDDDVEDNWSGRHQSRETKTFSSSHSNIQGSKSSSRKVKEEESYGDADYPPLTGRSATSAVSNSQAPYPPASSRPVAKRQMPLSFSQNNDASQKKPGKNSALTAGWE